jgi:serine protease Do
MERIVLRHLSGSKANQVEEFPLAHFRELIFGRDPSASVKYDPNRDDLVGRQHAKIIQDQADPTQFIVTDLNSRNGTFVNRQRIVGSVRIAPGDTVQFGAGGPEFQFDLEPRPPQDMRPTRMPGDGTTASYGASPVTTPPTRMGTEPSSMAQMGSRPMGPGPTMPAPGTVGKATVERMIAQNKNDNRKIMFIGGAALVLILVLVAGFLIYHQITSNTKLSSEISGITAGAPMTPADIAKAYTGSVVYIEAGWKLIYTSNGGQVYHSHIANRWEDGQGVVHYILVNGHPTVAAYVVVGQSVEPLLTLDNRSTNPPVGGEHSGTGFAVTGDGFILTNRHVGATWRTSYHFPDTQNFPDASTLGVIVNNGAIQLKADGNPQLVSPPTDWVPSETKQAGERLQGGFDGRNDYLNVTFPKNELRIPGKVARVSDRHDVAMLKIDVPDTVPKVELNDNYDTIKPGDASIVLGYPAISPPVYGVIRSQDVFNQGAQLKIIPDPTISVGNIGRVIRGADPNSGNRDMIVSGFGDAYQLTINSTGSGNSGGPVFDDRGRVTGIFFAGGTLGGASVTYAVPIRYGRELMSVSAPK